MTYFMNEEKCKFNYETKEELEMLHTKQLLNMRLYHTLPYDDCNYCKYKDECKKEFENYRSLIKEVLATRPHITNKKESKAIRKERIKKGK